MMLMKKKFDGLLCKMENTEFLNQTIKDLGRDECAKTKDVSLEQKARRAA